jgi:hypothetical protein
MKFSRTDFASTAVREKNYHSENKEKISCKTEVRFSTKSDCADTKRKVPL